MIRTVVVDDDYRVAELHGRYLVMTGGFAIVGTAHTGEETMRLLRDLRPDLLLLDIYLPDRSGLEVLRELRATPGTTVDVITITAARDVSTIRSAMQGGALHYLIKPFTFNAFREKLQAYAATRQRLTSLQSATQDDVDLVFGTLRPGDMPTPKGISVATRELVIERLREAGGPQSAAEVARLTGLSRVTARRYLEYLCRTRQAIVEMEYGSPGRPEHRYRLANRIS